MDIFDEDTVESISNIVESKMNLLKGIKEFDDKEKKLAMYIEELDNELPESLKEKFDEVMRIIYRLEEYYFTLAYSLGTKYGNSLNKI